MIVEQNARRALALADRGYVLELGRNRYEGTGLLHDPKVAELYLGGAVSTASSSTSTSAWRDEPGDVERGIRRVDSREGLPVGPHGTLPLAVRHQVDAGAQHVLPAAPSSAAAASARSIASRVWL